MEQQTQTTEDIQLAELAILKKEYRRSYLAEYSRENYEKNLKNTKVTCSICEKQYNVTNRWKHNNSKFHIFFKELLETRGLKPKEEFNSETI